MEKETQKIEKNFEKGKKELNGKKADLIKV